MAPRPEVLTGGTLVAPILMPVAAAVYTVQVAPSSRRQSL